MEVSGPHAVDALGDVKYSNAWMSLTNASSISLTSSLQSRLAPQFDLPLADVALVRALC